MKIYPLKFTPILKEKIWGGGKLGSEFNKSLNLSQIGESWELSGVEGNVSIVSNGDYKGIELNELLKEYRNKLVGRSTYLKYGNEFPLLFKFIDANDDLSIQLHPNDDLAKQRHNSFGKTEMWYVIEADNKSKIYNGFNQRLNKNSYVSQLNSGNILDVIHVDEALKGDAFFIEVGTVHAIGKGVLLAEIQQTSDVTYRIYDWDRLNDEGIGRELHTDLALDAIDFSKIDTNKIKYSNELNVKNIIHSCKYFTTNKLNLDNTFKRDVLNLDSFIVYMCVEGEAKIKLDNNYTEKIIKGETLLVPAATNTIEINVTKRVELLEVYIEE